MERPIRALIITPDAQRLETISQDLDSLQKLVGGYIEHVAINAQLSLLCNENGIMERLPLNQRAMDFIARFQCYHVLYGTIVIVGAVPHDAEYFNSIPEDMVL